MTQRWRQSLEKFPPPPDKKYANRLDSSPQRGSPFASQSDTFTLVHGAAVYQLKQ